MMTPQVVFFLGNELEAIHDDFVNHLDIYSSERTNILSYIIEEEEDNIALTNDNEGKEVILREDLLNKIDSIYQSIYTVGETSIDESHLTLTLVWYSLQSDEINHLAQFLYETIDKLYKLKDYPLTLLCINLSTQLASAINMESVDEENKAEEEGFSSRDDSNPFLASATQTNQEDDPTSLIYKNVESFKNKLDIGKVPAHLILVDNQNVLGKGLNFTQYDLSIVLAEFIESLYQHQVEIFSTWKPKVFSFGLSLLFYDFYRIKALIQHKLTVYNIDKTRLLDKYVSLSDIFNWVHLLYQNITIFNDEKRKELEVILRTEDPNPLELEDLNVNIKKEMIQNLKEHFFSLLQNNELTLKEKIYILELLLHIKEPPEGYSSQVANLSLIRYQLLEKLLEHSSEIELPDWNDIVLNKEDAIEQFNEIKESVINNEHLTDLQYKDNQAEKRLKEIGEEIDNTKEKMSGFMYFSHQLFNTKKHKKNEAIIKELTTEKESIATNKNLLTILTSYTIIFNLTFDLHSIINVYLSDLYKIQRRIRNEWDYCHSSIYQITNHVYHPLFIHTHKWTDIANTIDKNRSYDNQTNSKIALGEEEFLKKRKEDIKIRKEKLWFTFFASYDVTQELEEEIQKIEIPPSIQSSLNSFLIANIAPFIHLKGRAVVDKKRSRYLFANITTKEMNRRDVELKKNLNKFVDPAPSTLVYTNPYKMVSIEINDIINLKECTSFRKEEEEKQ